jgi:hypothetical protein
MRLLSLLLIGIALTGLLPEAKALATCVAEPACDTLYTTDGKYYLVKFISQTSKEIQFSMCNDPASTSYTLPLNKVTRTSRTVIPEGASEIGTIPAKDPMYSDPLVRKVRSTHTLAVLALIFMFTFYLSPAALVMGIIAVVNGERLLRNTPKDHKYYDYIRRRARKAIILGMLAMLIPFGIYFLIGPLL